MAEFVCGLYQMVDLSRSYRAGLSRRLANRATTEVAGVTRMDQSAHNGRGGLLTFFQQCAAPLSIQGSESKIS